MFDCISSSSSTEKYEIVYQQESGV